MTKSCRGKLYIDDVGWGPEAGSIEYGYRVPFGGIHVFIGKIGESGPEPDICTDLVETAQRASPARGSHAVKHAFVGCVHGIGPEPVCEDETMVYSNGESSTGETESLYQIHDGTPKGYSDGNNISDFLEAPSRVAIYMAGTQPVLQSSSTAAMDIGSAAVGGTPVRRPAQVLAVLMDAWATLLTATVTPDTRNQHDAEVARLKEQIAQAKEDLVAEDIRMTEEQAALNAQSQQIQA